MMKVKISKELQKVLSEKGAANILIDLHHSDRITTAEKKVSYLTRHSSKKVFATKEIRITMQSEKLVSIGIVNA